MLGMGWLSQPGQGWSIPGTELCHTSTASLPRAQQVLCRERRGDWLLSTDSCGLVSPGSPGSGQAGPAHHQGACPCLLPAGQQLVCLVNIA